MIRPLHAVLTPSLIGNRIVGADELRSALDRSIALGRIILASLPGVRVSPSPHQKTSPNTFLNPIEIIDRIVEFHPSCCGMIGTYRHKHDSSSQRIVVLQVPILEPIGIVQSKENLATALLEGRPTLGLNRLAERRTLSTNEIGC